MHLRIAGTAHTEISVFFDKTHQIGGVRKIRKYFSVEILGNISSQSQNILDSRRLHFCKSCADTAPVSTDTGQMRYRRHIVLLLNLSCQSNGMSLGAAAGTVSHAHISRLQCRDPKCCCLHISEIRTLLRRKYLKRDRCCIFIQNISDLHTILLAFPSSTLPSGYVITLCFPAKRSAGNPVFPLP